MMVVEKARRRVFKGKVTRVEEVDLDFGNGKQATYEVVKFKVITGVSALPITKDGVILIKHYQAGLGRESYSLPTGGLNKGEDPKERMQQELQEELGYKAGKLTIMLRAHPLPGYVGTEPGYLFLAEKLIKSKLKGDEDYDISVHQFSWEQVMGMVKRGEIIDTRTLVALLYYQRFYQ